MSKILMSVMAACGLFMAAPAAAQTEYLDTISLGDLQRVVADLDGTSEIVELETTSVLTITFDNGIKALAYLNCDEARCTGANMFATFNRGDTSVQDAMKKANDFDYSRDAISAGLDSSNDYYISRYLIMDYGVAYDNLLINVAVFANLAEEFGQL